MAAIDCDVELEEVVNCVNDAHRLVNPVEDLRHAIVVVILVARRVITFTDSVFKHEIILGKRLLPFVCRILLIRREFLQCLVAAGIQVAQVIVG